MYIEYVMFIYKPYKTTAKIIYTVTHGHNEC